MRNTVKNNSITVQAIAGTNCVVLGMDAAAAAIQGLLGFSIVRTNPATHEVKPLAGRLTFPGVDDASTDPLAHPIQNFLWSDYEATPATKYIYTVTPVYGAPGALKAGPAVDVPITTESETDPVHNVFFNRGAVAAEAFEKQFQVQLDSHKGKIDDLLLSPAGKPMRDWLARGVEDALLDFIGQAKDNTYGIRAAVYEFTWQPVLHAFGAAAARGADVKLMVAGQIKGNQTKQKDGTIVDESILHENKPAVQDAGIENIVTWRDNKTINISHNKFVILLEAGKPVAVWTGSTNMTDGGIFGQSNVGHLVTDPGVAATYLEYWNQLSTNPDLKPFAEFNLGKFPVPGQTDPGVQVIFSPRPKTEALEWYSSLIAGSENAAFITLPFGIGSEMLGALTSQSESLKFILMDTTGEPALKKNFAPVTAIPWNRVAVGEVIQAGVLEGWNQARLTGANSHVRFIHTKYILIDPLGKAPLVITGSANFSDASIQKNDENSLVIHNNPRVADLYLTEFLRQFVHFAFADHVMGDAATVKGTAADAKKKSNSHRDLTVAVDPASAPKKLSLTADDSWTKPYFTDPAAIKMRQYFS